MEIKIFIPGQTPSKKNSKKLIITGDGRRRVMSSDFYEAWEKESLRLLRRSDLVGHPWRYPLRAGFHFIRNSRRKWDYGNLMQGPLDLLVQAGIIEDDDMNHIIPNGSLSWEVGKGREGVVITLEEIDAHPRDEGILRARALPPEDAPPDQGQGPQGDAGLAAHSARNAGVPVPGLRRVGARKQTK